MSASNLYKTRSKRTGAWFLPGSPGALGLRGPRGLSPRPPGAFFSPPGAEDSSTASRGLSPAGAHASGTGAAPVNLGPGELRAARRLSAARRGSPRAELEAAGRGNARAGSAARGARDPRRADGRTGGWQTGGRVSAAPNPPLQLSSRSLPGRGPQAVASGPAANCHFPSVVRAEPRRLPRLPWVPAARTVRLLSFSPFRSSINIRVFPFASPKRFF